MNIFAFDEDPRESARTFVALDKIRARKQIVEIFQMMACLYHGDTPKKDGTPYKKNKAMRNHPATQWIEEWIIHADWCLEYAFWLMELLTKGGAKNHGCWEAYKLLYSKFALYQAPTERPDFRWLTKKCEQLDDNIFVAHELYIKAKLNGFYGN